MQYWLMKSEPSTYSIDSLLGKPRKTDVWDGVRNYQARNYLRSMQKGDLAFFYHSSCEVPGIVGLMEITKAASPDLSAFDPRSPYYDPRSTPESPRWFKVEVKAVEKFEQELPLALLKTQSGLHKMALLKQGNRLSVMPLDKKEWDLILKLKA